MAAGFSAFGRRVPVSPFVDPTQQQDPNAPDAGAMSAGPDFAMPAKAAAQVGGGNKGGGFFSAFGRWATPSRLALIGAALSGQDAFSTEQQRQQGVVQQKTQAEIQGETFRRQQQQWAQQDDQTKATDAAIAQIRPTLSPDQQRLLDADSQGYISRLVQQAAPGWQAGWDRTYRINPDGGTTLGGPIPHAPPSATSLMGTGTDAPFTPRPAGAPPPRAVRTPQEAQALPPGTHYTTPDGREFVR